MRPAIGLDLGGANLKLANAGGWSQSTSFPLWKQLDQLPQTLTRLLQQAPDWEELVVTMTGELADCFHSRKDGVTQLVSACVQASAGKRVRFYAHTGEFLDSAVAIEHWDRVASANWHALAQLAGSIATAEVALLVDIGSTTTDLIPLKNGVPCPTAHTDLDRLACGELAYTGVRRSPVCAVAGTLPWQGKPIPVAQELFATMGDVYLLLGDLTEEPNRLDTADGRSFTVSCAKARLARMLLTDVGQEPLSVWQELAVAARAAQLSQLGRAGLQVVRALPAKPSVAVTSGEGEFLARQLLAKLCPAATVIGLGERLGPEISSAGAAYAIAWLASRPEPA